MPKILALLATLLINIAAGVVIFFFMILAMNGFSESDANYGLATYIVLAVIVSLLMATLTVLTVHVLMNRHYRGWTSALIAVPIFSVIGGVLKLVSCFVGLMVADYVRVNY